MKRMARTVSVPLSIACVWFATHAGPGAATGKQAAVYYSTYGLWGFVMPLVSMALLALCVFYALEYARIHHITDFKTFTNRFFHPYEKFFSTFYEITYLVTVILVISGELAAGSALLHDYLKIPTMIGTVLLIFLMVILAIYGVELVRSSSTLMSVLLIVCLGSIVGFGLYYSGNTFVAHMHTSYLEMQSLPKALMMAFVYTGFMAAGNMAASVSVSTGLRSRKESIKAASIGFVLNSFLILAVVFLLFAYPQYATAVLPNYSVVSDLGMGWLRFAYVLMVFLAIVSTGVSYCYSTVARYSALLPMKEGPKRNALTLAVLIGITFLVSLAGFEAIITIGYKYLGYACIFFVVLPTICIGWKKIRS